MFDGWKPADVIDAGKLLLSTLQFCGTIVVLVLMVFMKRDVDGRFSQMIELVGRALGAPPDRREREADVNVERRSKNK